MADRPRLAAGPDDLPAYLPAAWTASLAGVLAGAALFGGTPIAAIFWLTIGVVAACAALPPSAGDGGVTDEPLRIVHAIARLNVGGQPCP